MWHKSKLNLSSSPNQKAWERQKVMLNQSLADLLDEMLLSNIDVITIVCSSSFKFKGQEIVQLQYPKQH